MKHSILILLFFALSARAAAQFVNGVNIGVKPEIGYIRVNDVRAAPRFKDDGNMIAHVDYGQRGIKTERELTDSTGQQLRFHSRMAILNYLYALGWRLPENKYQIDTDQSLLNGFILKRKED